MTAYTSIADTQVDPEAPITSELMTALRDNPIAITEGSSGAPKVQTAGLNDSAVTNAKVANGAVTQPKISTGTSSVSAVSTNPATITIALNAYSFFPSVLTSEDDYTYMVAVGGVSGSADNPRFGISNQTGVNIIYTVYWRYINA